MDKNTLTLLHVEDSEIFAAHINLLVEKYAESCDYKIKLVHCTGVAEARERLEKDHFDAAIFDLNLGEGTGEGINLIKLAKKKDIYSICLSNYAGEPEIIYFLGSKLNCPLYQKDKFDDKSLSIMMDKIKNNVEQRIFNEFFNPYLITHSSSLKHNILDTLNSNSKIIIVFGEKSTGKTSICQGMSRYQSKPLVEIVGPEQFNVDQFPNFNLHYPVNSLEEGINHILHLKNLIHFTDHRLFIEIPSSNLPNWFLEKVYRYSNCHIGLVRCPKVTSRREDILPLFEDFYKREDANFNLTEECKEQLRNYHWPNNIAEIKSTVKQLKELKKKDIFPDDLPFYHNKSWDKNILTDHQFSLIQKIGIYNFLELIKEESVLKSYHYAQKKSRKAIRMTKISSSVFYKILKKLGTAE